jgi:LmbE family N-acetylglucosaminyl deacetylase
MPFTLKAPKADIFVPDNAPVDAALARTTHLAIGAHQDDLEIFAYHGIAECYGKKDLWFTGVTVTDGAGSARTGLYADCTDEQMQLIRLQEQRKAAFVGDYAAQIQLRYSSKEVKDPKETKVIEDIFAILMASKPQVVYLHNPADKHDTHVGTMCRTIAALRKMPADARPFKVYGCEVWRDLDWLGDDEKVQLPANKMECLANSLVSLYDSQISGGKRYDLATAGRRLANATYSSSHAVDACSALINAVDLTPLVQNPNLSIAEFILGAVDRFRADVADRIAKLG